MKLTRLKLKEIIREELLLEGTELVALEADVADIILQIGIWHDDIPDNVDTNNKVSLENKRGVTIKTLVKSSNLLRKNLKKADQEQVVSTLKTLGFEMGTSFARKRYPLSDLKIVAQELAKIK